MPRSGKWVDRVGGGRMTFQLDHIYNENCLQGMKRIPDRSIDLILCDLPYGVLNRGNAEAAWDCPLPMDQLWAEYLRIAKPNAAIILFGQGMFTAQLMASNSAIWRYNLVWKKGNRITGFLNAKRMPLRQHEDICVFYREQPKYHPQMTIGQLCHKRNSRNEGHVNRCWGKMKVAPTTISNKKYPVSILDFDKEHPSVHPTQKPVALLAWLIKTYSDVGDVVLDNCSGSGSTAAASILTNRHFVAFETTEKYYNLSVSRVQKLRVEIESRIKFEENE